MRSLNLKNATIVSLTVLAITSTIPAGEPQTVKLRIAFTSLRERPRYTVVHFYDHDGVSSGKVVGKVALQNDRSDHHPSLSSDGRFCAFAAEVVAKVSTIRFWQISLEKPIEMPAVEKTPNAQMAPSLSGDGNLIAFEAWNRPGSAGRWDILLYDRRSGQFRDAPGLNTSRFDERKPSLSSDGRWIAFTSNDQSGSGLTDVRLYDRKTEKVLALPDLNSPHMDTEPSLSADGSLIAFVSDRRLNDESYAGTRDIFLYNRIENRLLPLPELNSPGQEQSPSISPSGRFLAFVSERLDSAGERDIFVYDRQKKTLLQTPGLNSPQDEYDPCLIELSLK